MRNHKTSENRNVYEKSWLFLDHDYDHTIKKYNQKSISIEFKRLNMSISSKV